MKQIHAPIIALAFAFSTQTQARDGQPYLEIDGGLTAPNDSNFDSVADPDIIGTIEWSNGLDLAAIAGYDFGGVRLEAEVSFKDHSFDQVADEEGNVVTQDDGFDFGFKTWSAMVNGLVDLGPADGFNGFVGGGVGLASTKLSYGDPIDSFNDADGSFAWQLLAGVRTPISDSIDVGLKYRYFRQNNLEFIILDDDDFNTRFSSHSALVTLTYNLGGKQ